MEFESLPRLAIVVVNYGSHELLETNLTRVARSARDATVVVVDNFTTDSERQTVAGLAATERWTAVLLPTNSGFGGGINRGVEAARAAGATSFLLLNPDAHLDRASIQALLARSVAEPMALISPRVLTPAGTPWFDGADLYLRDGVSRARRKREQHPDERIHPWLSGACLIVSEVLWTRIGGFDEEYFLYWEDVDLSFRVVQAGGTLVVADDAVAIHDEGGTHGEDARTPGSRGKSSIYYYYNVRNRLLFAARHLPTRDRRRWMLGALPAAWDILMQGGKRQFRHPIAPLCAAVRGTVHGLRLSLAVGRTTKDP